MAVNYLTGFKELSVGLGFSAELSKSNQVEQVNSTADQFRPDLLHY